MLAFKTPLFLAFTLNVVVGVRGYSIDPESCNGYVDKIKDGVEGAMARAELTARELSGSNSEVFDVSSYMIHKNQMGTAKSTFQRIAQQQHLVDVEDDDPEQPTIFCNQDRLDLLDLEDGESKWIYHTVKNEAWQLGDDYEACEKGHAAGYTLNPDRGENRKPEIQICPSFMDFVRNSPVIRIDDIPDEGEWRDVEKKSRDEHPDAKTAIDRFRLLDHLMLHEFAHTPKVLHGSPIPEVYFWKPCTELGPGKGIKNADSLAYVGLANDLLARPGLKVKKDGELDF